MTSFGFLGVMSAPVLGIIGLLLLDWRMRILQRQLRVSPKAPSEQRFPPRGLRGWANYLGQWALVAVAYFALYKTTLLLAVVVLTFGTLALAIAIYRARVSQLRNGGATNVQVLSLLGLGILAISPLYWFVFRHLESIYGAV